MTVRDGVAASCGRLRLAEATAMAEAIGQNRCWRIGMESVRRLQPRLKSPGGAIEQRRIKRRPLQRMRHLHARLKSESHFNKVDTWRRP